MGKGLSLPSLFPLVAVAPCCSSPTPEVSSPQDQVGFVPHCLHFLCDGWESLFAAPKWFQRLPVDLEFSSDLNCRLGESFLQIITDRPGFHDGSAIYPVGYCSTRVYASMKCPAQKCLYTCQIKDGGAQPQVFLFAKIYRTLQKTGHGIKLDSPCYKNTFLAKIQRFVLV